MKTKPYPVSGKPVPPLAYRTEPNYFYAFIGPISREELDEKCPNGEGGLRSALQNAYRARFGGESSCSSGWGTTPQQKEDASYSLYDDDVKKQLIRSYHAEGKPMPRALRAWELLFQEQDKAFIKQMDKTIGNVVDKKRKSRNTH